MVSTKQKTVPRAALRFRVPVQFAKAKEKAADAEEAGGETPITMLARSAEPISHWYWGKIAHDMQGMQLRKETLPLDYCHDPGQIVGYADKFTADDDGLTVAGKLVSVFAGDRVDEITRKAAKGIPYEASIDFYGPMRLEEVHEGFSAQCNGKQIDGPALIVREWTLNAVAVCPLGADPNTRSQFAAGEPDQINVTLFSEHDPMAEKPASTETTKLSEPPAPQADPRAEFKATLAKFTAKFGAANGALWAAEGKTYEEALELHADAQAAQLKAATDAKDKEIDELKTKLAAVPQGEREPVSFNDEKKPSPGTAKPGETGGLTAFAKSIKLPEGYKKA